MGPGFDHGVFIPFRLMFGETFLDVPIVEVSMDGTLSPEKNWAVGQAVKQLRYATRIAFRVVKLNREFFLFQRGGYPGPLGWSDGAQSS